MSKLTKLLEIAFAKNNTERESLINKESTKLLLGEKTHKMLLQSNAIEQTFLLQEEVYKTISDGAEPFKCMRDILPIIKTDTYSVRVVRGEVGSYAEAVAEGAKVPIDTQTYTKKDITIGKIGTRPIITNELIEDCLFDIAQLELKKAGMRMENKLNRDCLVELLSDQGVTAITPDGAHLAVTDLAKLRADIEAGNYIPDTLLLHPSAEGYIMQDSNLLYVAWAGQNKTLNTGKLPTMLGLTPYVTTITTGSTSYYWDGTAGATHWNAGLISAKDCAYLAMRRDLTVEEYDDPIHDILGIACTMRYGVEVVQNAAQAYILAK
jgi:HK97 family phage major capsid protein